MGGWLWLVTLVRVGCHVSDGVEVVGQRAPALPDAGALAAFESGAPGTVLAFHVGDASLGAYPEVGQASAGSPGAGVVGAADDEGGDASEDLLGFGPVEA